MSILYEFYAVLRVIFQGVCGLVLKDDKNLALVKFMPSEGDLEKLQPLYKPFSELIVKLLEKAKENGLTVNIFEGLRTFERQEKLYQQGRTTAGKIVTWTRLSPHSLGLAVDIVFKDKKGWTWEGKWDLLGKLGKEVGLEWGGDFNPCKDSPHFQLLCGQKVQFLKEIYDKKGLEGVYEYLDRVRV